MPFVAPKSTTNSTTGAAGRTTFRPPWVKDDGAQSGLKPTPKTSVPWARKTADAKDTPTEKPNSTTSILKKPAASTTASKTNAEPSATLKKTSEPLKKSLEPPKKVIAPVKKEPEPIKKATTTNASKTPVGKTTLVKKKEPTPPSSSEEEETEEEEEETEEESEEEESEEEESEEEESEEEESEEEESEEEVKSKPTTTTAAKKPQTTNNATTTTAKKIIPPKTVAPKKEEEESELKRRFSLEKPKLRPVVVKRDKSMKKIEDDEEPVDGETEEERERRLRFKLDKPKLRHVKREEKPLPSKSTENILKIRPVLKKVPKVDEILKDTKEDPKPEFKTKTLRKTPSIKREPSIKNVPAPPPLPSLVPKAPPPPPPPLGKAGEKKDLTEAQKKAIEKLKIRPRRRPDWSEMMKEVESGRKLRHVECNDRSQPILVCKSMTKVDDKFIFETEKDNSHNKLLQQIQGGIKLKPTRTNDRSKPFIEGLRKFRRQMTIEEQIQKSQSKVNMLLGSAPGGAADTTDGAASSASSTRHNSIVPGYPIDLDGSGDELDDIDKIRDDLQSTKQMLALELRNREAQERENKKLLAKIATLEAELEREKSREKTLEYGSRIIVATMETTPASEEAYVNSLKQEAEESKKTAKDLEKKYLSTGEMLDQAKSEIEEQKRQIQMLERKLAQAMQGGGLDSRRASDVHNGRDSSPDFDLGESESDPDEPEEKKAERRERRLVKEVKVLRSKLTKIKVKEEAAKKEKTALKEAMKKNHVILKEENKKFKKLEKEVHKMAASMKEDAEEEEDNDEDEEEKEEKEEEEESEEESDEESEESESEESGNETASESEAEDAPTLSKKENLEPRLKKHEGRLSAMKKCNVLLQANVDNLQDEISQVRYKASNLQSELDSVLADLGF